MIRDITNSGRHSLIDSTAAGGLGRECLHVLRRMRAEVGAWPKSPVVLSVWKALLIALPVLRSRPAALNLKSPRQPSIVPAVLFGPRYGMNHVHNAVGRDGNRIDGRIDEKLRKVRMVARRLSTDAHGPLRHVGAMNEIDDHLSDGGLPLVEEGSEPFGVAVDT